jgi:diadenosine tetraphosphate (Ap4A) HIT family hydrolase
MKECLACELTEGRLPLPGGLIYSAAGWRIEHCVGPLGLGTLVVKPERHVTAVADLTEEEAAALGRLLRQASVVAGMLVHADQVYNCLWSHAGGTPGHIHYVIQPATKAQMTEFGCHGPNLQTAMFAVGRLPDPVQVEAISEQARLAFSRGD